MPLLNEKNTILLKPMEALGQYDEGRVATGETLKPGMLIDRIAAGTFQVHKTAGGGGEFLLMIEDGLIGDSVDDARTAGQLVRFIKPKPGDVVYVRIPPSATAIVIGDDLVSNGDGKFKKTAGSSNTVFGSAEDAYDNSANASTDAWIRLRVSAHGVHG